MLNRLPLLVATAFCFAVYLVVLTSVPTDWVGDTPDYLGVAFELCRESHVGGFNYLRGFGYPAFQCAASGGLSYVPAIFYVQGVLFLTALYLACRDLAFGSQWSVLAVAAAAIPYYAYLQKLLYADGLIASLVLFYLVLAARRRTVPALLMAAVLTLTKILFVFLFAHIALLWLLDRYDILKRPKATTVAAVLGAIGFFAAHLVLFPALSFMVTFVRPVTDGVNPQSLIPNGEFGFNAMA